MTTHEQRKRRNAGCRQTIKFQRPLLAKRCTVTPDGVSARNALLFRAPTRQQFFPAQIGLGQPGLFRFFLTKWRRPKPPDADSKGT